MSAPLALSEVAVGAWRLREWQWSLQERLRWTGECLDRGLSTFDHADLYGHYEAEGLFGEALAAQPGLRQRMQLVSKCGIKLVSPARPQHRLKHYDSSAAHVRASVETSLRQLRTGHLDLLLIHRPDVLMDADELAQVFEALRREGKVLHFGVSNFSPSQWTLLNSRFPLATHQVEASALHLEPFTDGTFDLAQQQRWRPMLWSPLAGGRLFTANDERSQRVRGVMEAMAAGLGCSLTALALAWLRRHPCRPVPVLGSRRLGALDDAQQALGLSLSREQWYAVWEASLGHPVA